ncbi:transposase [Streptomyces sp. VRA16 Mangrove soil]|uniref:transposase n=1 Tax=Streptomyces sp. VRA16 Mangrove soil TaxID=2817434 RepID=UPI001A9DA2CB|nr:transposase [Streptomyces sp. VRA16 Mangrove soil]MBO1332569.1 transposase [Streptomyces sp. VRA16 Mangrove soil]
MPTLVRQTSTLRVPHDNGVPPRPSPVSSYDNPSSSSVAGILGRCPELAAAEQLVRSFTEILTTRSGQHLKDWVIAAQAKDLPSLHAFAHGLEKGWDAVLQGLTTRWNSGPVEGRVNHIKMIKRQMFGRAKLPLLRKRVLLTAAQGRSARQDAALIEQRHELERGPDQPDQAG